MRPLIVLLLLAPTLFAQPLRVSEELPVAAIETGQMTGDDAAPQLASNGSGSFAIWRNGEYVFGTRISPEGVVLDRPAREFGTTGDDPRIASNGQTYLIVTTTDTSVILTELAASGSIVNQRTIFTTRPDFPAVAWNGSSYLLTWIVFGRATGELLNRDLTTVRTIDLGNASRLAIASNGGVFLAVIGSDVNKSVHSAIVSASGIVSTPRELQSGTGNIVAVAAQAHGGGFIGGFSAAIEEVVAIDASGTPGTRVRLEGGALTSIASTGGAVYATTSEWVYTLDPALNVLFRERNYVGALAGDGRALVASILDGYDRDIFTFRAPAGGRTLVSYSLQRQLVQSARWTGDHLTFLWEYGTIPTISRLTSSGVPIDGPGVSLADENALPSRSDPFYEGQSALAWNGSRYAVAYADAFSSCCRRFLRVLDGNLAPVTTQPFRMRGSYGKLTASDGHNFLFVDRFGTALVTPDGAVANEDLFRDANEYEEHPRRVLWLGNEYLVLQRNGEVDRVARDGTVLASHDGAGALDVAFDGHTLMALWPDRGRGWVYAGPMNLDGTPAGDQVQALFVSQSLVPFIAWDAVSWVLASMDENAALGTLLVRRLRYDGEHYHLYGATYVDLPPNVWPIAFEGGRGRSAAVYARQVGQGVLWQRLRSFVRIVTSSERRVFR